MLVLTHALNSIVMLFGIIMPQTSFRSVGTTLRFRNRT